MRYIVRTPEQLADFKAKFIPNDCTVRLPEKNELPLHAPKEGETAVYTIYFEQAGFRLPLDPLLASVMRATGLSLCQLSPNGIRVILGCSELNKRLKTTLTHRELFYCYSLCRCPKVGDGLYLRTRSERPDLVKCLTSSEKDYNKDIIVVGGNWKGKNADGSEVTGVYSRINNNYVNLKSPPDFEVDFASINKVLKYNGEDLSDVSKHLRAAHNLLNYTPHIVKWITERLGQPQQVGPSQTRVDPPKELGKRKKKKRVVAKGYQLELQRRHEASRPTAEFVAEAVVVGPPQTVVATGEYCLDPGVVGTSLAKPKGKGEVIPVSPSHSSDSGSEHTDTDTDIEDLFREDHTEVIMPIQRRSVVGSLRAQGAGSSNTQDQSSNAADKSSPVRKRLRTEEAPAVEAKDQRVEIPAAQNTASPLADRGKTDVAGDLPVVNDDIWRPVFEVAGRPLKCSDSLYESPSVAISLLQGITKREDEIREGRKPIGQVRAESYQNIIKGLQQASFVDNRRLTLIHDQSMAITQLESEKEDLNDQLKSKKRDLNRKTLDYNEVKAQLEDQEELLKTLKANLADRDKKLSDLEAREKRMADLEAKEKSFAEKEAAMSSELEAAEQRGYDSCFKQQEAEMKIAQRRLYQAGYDLGLDEALIPSTSQLRVQVTIPSDFDYLGGEVPEVEEGNVGGSAGLAIAGDGNVDDNGAHNPTINI